MLNSATGHTHPLLDVRGLGVEVATASGSRPVLANLSFTLEAGKVLCLAGESGSGKSMTALAIMGLLPEPTARISDGKILLDGEDLVGLSESALRRVRAARIGMIFQEPMTSLNPLMRIGTQLTEVLMEHSVASDAQDARTRAISLLEEVRLTSPGKRLDQYPHELSGGMRQRVMIAMALACRPKVLIADEPTTALDVTVQAEILDLIRGLGTREGMSMLMITHDMGVVAEMADRVIVLREGRLIEAGEVRSLFSSPAHPYTRALLDAVPRLGSSQHNNSGTIKPQNTISPNHTTNEDKAYGSARTGTRPAIQAKGLDVRFPVRAGVFGRVTQEVRAVTNVSFVIAPGETLALVGESGSGKSTIGRALLSLVPFQGSVRIDNEETAGMPTRLLRRKRRDVQMIFQDPYASLDPRMSVGEQVAEPLVIHGIAHGRELQMRVAKLFERVGLSPDHLARHPHEFSGGQRQRVCIARALALSPKVIVADECVSALDVSVQARVLDLLKALQEEHGIAYLFISHDMAVVEQISDHVAVLRAGCIIEHGSRSQVLGDPQHPYTRRLLSAVPIPDPEHKRPPMTTANEATVDVIRDIGDAFNAPTLREVDDGHWVAA